MPEATAAQKPAAHSQLAALHPKPKTEPGKNESGKNETAAKTEPAKPAAAKEAAKSNPPQDANATTASTSSTINGAQPVVPAGNFDSRWAAVR